MRQDTIDILIVRDGNAWRLYSAVNSWRPPPISDRMDSRGDIVPVPTPDLDDLHKFMWECDAPYEVLPTTDGGAEIRAHRRSAFILWFWLEEYLTSVPKRVRHA